MEIGYIYQHRPSAKFVLFNDDPSSDGYTYMKMVPYLKSYMIMPCKESAKHALMNAVDDNGDRYGHDNLYEFELRTVHITLSLI